MRNEELMYKVRTQVEVYKPVKGHARYMVSSMGNVKNIKTGRILKPTPNSQGYFQVCLCSNNKRSELRVHRIVAKTFIPNPENKSDVNHKNEIKTDNKLANLEWMTHRDNVNFGTRNKRVAEANSKEHKGMHWFLGEDGKRHWTD